MHEKYIFQVFVTVRGYVKLANKVKKKYDCLKCFCSLKREYGASFLHLLRKYSMGASIQVQVLSFITYDL